MSSVCGSTTETSYLDRAFGVTRLTTATTLRTTSRTERGTATFVYDGDDNCVAKSVSGVTTNHFVDKQSYENSGLDPRSLHKYSYAAADPVNKSDPTGDMYIALDLFLD